MQFTLLVPQTVKVVLPDGVYVTAPVVGILPEPSVNVYVLAPDGDMVNPLPWQVVPLFTIIKGGGVGSTVTVDSAALPEMQPARLVPYME
jgi:hypothetical protein